MKTLIVYDMQGRVWFTASGDLVEPSGIPFLWITLEPNQYVEFVNVEDIDNPVPIIKTFEVHSDIFKNNVIKDDTLPEE